jgi:hypothetical protein
MPNEKMRMVVIYVDELGGHVAHLPGEADYELGPPEGWSEAQARVDRLAPQLGFAEETDPETGGGGVGQALFRRWLVGELNQPPGCLDCAVGPSRPCPVNRGLWCTCCPLHRPSCTHVEEMPR